MKKLNNKASVIHCFIISILFLPATTIAQSKNKEVNNMGQSWFSVNSTVRLHQKFGLVGDMHVRRNNWLADPGFYFARIGANYWLKENITVTVGYAQLWMAPAKTGWHYFAREKRIYQQIQMSSKIGKIGLINRLRNEQRWHERVLNDQFINSHRFSNRVRYLLSATIPFSKNPRYPSLVVSDELLIQFGKEIVYNTFDQNRAFIGIKQPICKSLSADLGYMLVYQQKASGYQYDRNHTLRCFFYYTPDFRKKK